MPILSRNLCWIALATLFQASSGLPASTPSAKPPLSWASVSIHVSDPNGDGNNYSREQPDGMTERGMSLREIISEGYNFSVMPFREDEISGLPDWAKTERYDILARVDPDDVEAFKKLSGISMQETIAAFTARQPTGQMLMMQALLQDRFGLRVHWESKERSVYAVTVAKGGLRMKPAADPLHGEMSFSQGHLAGKGVPISFLASLLAMPVGHTVVDKSGMAGSYDFDLHFDTRDNPTAPESSDPDLFTAVQEQLGLKLQSTHASVPVLVVDHVERPTAN
ncbi:MAG TPA: TIGR03435 family protein [Acidobacteriaceae bacterium]